jgi:hypothetical protein
MILMDGADKQFLSPVPDGRLREKLASIRARPVVFGLPGLFRLGVEIRRPLFFIGTRFPLLGRVGVTS